MSIDAPSEKKGADTRSNQPAIQNSVPAWSKTKSLGNESRDLDDLPSISVFSNWKLPSSRQSHLMVHDMGPHLDEIAQEFLDKIAEEEKAGLTVGYASEMEIRGNLRRPIRIAHRFQAGHLSTTDVVLNAESDDLYVSFGSRPSTLLTYLNFLLRGSVLVLLVISSLWAYLQFSGARISWIKDYADKYSSLNYSASADSKFATQILSNGGVTLDWSQFKDDIFSNEKTRRLIDTGFQEVANSLSSNPDDLGRLMMLNTLNSWGDNRLQMMADGWIQADYGKGNAFIWTDADRPIIVSFGQVSGVEDNGECEWSTVELVSVDALRNRFATFGLGEELSGRMLSAFDRATTYQEPWSILQLLRADPRTALFNIGMPATILAGVFGFLVWRAPRSWLRFPCRLLGWITPDDFNSKAIARNAWVERQLSKTLTSFGVGRGQITELQGGSHA